MAVVLRTTSFGIWQLSYGPLRSVDVGNQSNQSIKISPAPDPSPAVFIILVVSGSSSSQFLNMSNYVSSSNRVTSFPIDMVKAESNQSVRGLLVQSKAGRGTRLCDSSGGERFTYSELIIGGNALSIDHPPRLQRKHGKQLPSSEVTTNMSRCSQDPDDGHPNHP